MSIASYPPLPWNEVAPVISATASVMVCDAGVMVATRRPRRITCSRSAISNTCGMLWLIRTTGVPRARTVRIKSSTIPDSRTPSAAVGSSMITTRLAKAAAPATANPRRPPPPGGPAQRRRRLIHDHDPARERRRTGDRNPLALAARERLDRLLHRPDIDLQVGD